MGIRTLKVKTGNFELEIDRYTFIRILTLWYHQSRTA